jgi:hypothetical protein
MKCPDCDSQLSHNGFELGNFHAVLSDHKVKMQKVKCKNKECRWSHNPSITSHFGASISPELIKIQAEFGATMSFRKARNCLDTVASSKRPINNHMRTRRSTILTGKNLVKYRLNKYENNQIEKAQEHKTVLATTDGIFLHDFDNVGHNFEVMTTKIYNIQDISKVSNNRHKITKKHCVTSSLKDSQKSIKEKVRQEATLAKIDKNTTVMALADGATNCWNVLQTLAPLCGFIMYILDWWHINQAFNKLLCQLPDDYKTIVMTARNATWYGEVELALSSLSKAIPELSLDSHKEKLQNLMTYLENNKYYIINYNDYMHDGLPYSSQSAESTVEHLVARAIAMNDYLMI